MWYGSLKKPNNQGLYLPTEQTTSMGDIQRHISEMSEVNDYGNL
jgi:hypothetical protein